MTRTNHISLTTTFLLLLILVLAGCSLPGTDSQNDGQTATQTPPALSDAQSDQQPTNTAPPPTSTITPTQPVEHQITPQAPAGVSGVLTDLTSASLADEGRAIADSFVANLLERPFTAQEMAYLPHLDIIAAEISKNGDFLYVSIRLEQGPSADSEAFYGVELDLDVDGRGDWLILAAAPTDTSWSVEGVRACRDADEDIGAGTPMRSDPPDQDLTGYEECVFEAGRGISSDEAWVRLSPDDPSIVEIAFLHSLIEQDPQFLWGVWADADEGDPAAFDYHDRFTLEQAGSAEISSDAYPLNELAQVDNTCRWAYGFTPAGTEPGLCTPPATPTPEVQEASCVKGESPGPGFYWDEGSCQWKVIN